MVGRFSALVGRDDELALLEDAARRGRTGTCTTVLLRGPAGIGKTHLVTELARRCEDAGDDVIWARCSNDPGAPHHWAWMQVLRSAARRIPEDRLVDRLGSGLGHLLRAVPGLLGAEHATDHGPAGHSGSDVFGFYDAALTLLREAAGSPVVVVIEDLHWSDPSSLRLLDLVARSLHDVPLTVVGTHRDLEAAVDPTLSDGLDAVARSAAVVPLHGLSREAVAELVALRTGSPCTGERADELHRLTGGSPFLVDDAVRLQEADLTLGDEHRRPHTLLGTARAAYRRLAPAERTVLAGGAVIGVEFDEHLVSAVTEQPPSETSSTFEDLARRGIVSAAGDGRRWRFAHDLLRDAALAESDGDVLARWNLRVAELLGERGGSGEIAAHLLAAGTLAPPEVVAEACRRAGQEATHRLAHAEAVRWTEIALEHLYRSAAASDDERLAALLMLGDAQMRAGRATAALGTFERARTLADHRHDAVAYASAAVGTAEARRRGPGWEYGLDDLQPLLTGALARLSDDADPVLRARLLAHLSAGAAMASDPVLADAHATEAATVAAGTEDLVARHAALLAQRWAIVGPAPLAEKQRLTEQLALLAAQTDDPHGQWWAARWQLYDGLEAGDPARVERALASSTVLAERIAEPDLSVDTLVQRGTVVMLEGRFAELQQLHAEARSMAQRCDIGQEPILGQELFASRERGELRIDVLRMILEANPRPIYRALVCWGAVNLRRVDDARTEFERFFTSIDLDDLDGVYLPAILAMMSEAAAFLQDADRARMLGRRLSALADQCVLAGIGPYVWTGSVHHYLGMLATVTGDHDEARAHLEEAMRVHQRMGARPWVLRTELARARLDAASGAAARGAATAERVAAEARALGMVALAGDAESMRTPSPAPSTTTERWKLVREGATWLLETPRGSHRLRHRKGLGHLSALLRQPGREIHVLQLSGGGAPQDGAGPVLDDRAKQAYRLRVEDLRDQIEEGERWGDAERAQRAQEELDAIAAQLAGAVGLGGRDRTSGDAGERARVSVTKALRSAVDSLGEAAPEVATHLTATVRTGVYCAYEPDPAAPVVWELT